MKFLIAILISFNSIFAFAAGTETTTRVVTVTSDAAKGEAALDMTLDANGAISWLTYVGFDGTMVRLSVPQLLNTSQLLAQMSGSDVTFLNFEAGFDLQAGGYGNLRFLSNGISNSYLHFRFKISIDNGVITIESAPNLNDPNSDKNTYRGPLNHLFMKKKTFFGSTIGIAQIQPSLK